MDLLCCGKQVKQGREMFGNSRRIHTSLPSMLRRSTASARLLADMAALTLNQVTVPRSLHHALRPLAQPTEPQVWALLLLKIDPARDVAM